MKETHTVELHESQWAFLKQMAREYELPDAGKALRCLVNFAAAEESERTRIFTQVRCRDC